MTDEEKKAIEEIRIFNQYNWEMNNLKTKKDAKPYFDSLDTILNLIEKQSKQIEKLQVINQMQKYRIEVMDPRELISRDEVKEIIKVKIEEYEEKFKAQNGKKTINYHLYRIIIDEVLKPLLDKIKGDDK